MPEVWPPVIGLCGLAGSGKSTLARQLERAGYYRLPFAAPLKSMLAALGCSDEQLYGAEKETPSDLLCGKTAREAMQTLGTEWGRNLIGADLWTNAWNMEAQFWPLVVADDVRFPNEGKVIRDNGGVVIELRRPGAGTINSEHASEALLVEPDYMLDNEGDESDLWRAFRKIFE